MEPGDQHNVEARDRQRSNFATGFGPMEAFNSDHMPGNTIAHEASDNVESILQSLHPPSHPQYTGQASEHPFSDAASAVHFHAQTQQGMSYVDPPTFQPQASSSGAGDGSSHQSIPDDQDPHLGPTAPHDHQHQHRCGASTTYNIGDLNVEHHTVSLTSPVLYAVDLETVDPSLTFYGAFNRASELQTRELLRYIPIPAKATPATASTHPLNADAPESVSLSRFLRQGATHKTLLEFSQFVKDTLLQDDFTSYERAIAIEGRAVDILEDWGKCYAAAHIMAATPVALGGNLQSLFLPFENSIEVTVLLAIVSQFDLRSKTDVEVRQGWRHVFDQSRVDWYDVYCVTPAIAMIISWFNLFLVTGCHIALSLASNHRVFSDLAHYISIEAWADLERTLLELATSGGYLHHFDVVSSSYTRINDPQIWDLKVTSTYGRICLMLARRVGLSREPGDTAVVLLFRHLSLCAMSTWIINYLVKSGARSAVELFVDGDNPFIVIPEVDGNYVPPWTWLTAVSSGFVSVALAGIEELGFVGLTGSVIVNNAYLMQLYAMKVKCTRELIIDLWLDPMKLAARIHIEWVSRYNLLKASWAVMSPRLHSNAPSLYVAWDPMAVNIDDQPGFRGLNPTFSTDFMAQYRTLAQGVGEQEVLPFGQPLLDLYEKSFHMGEQRLRERIQGAFRHELMSMSVRTIEALGEATASRVSQILASAAERTTRKKQEMKLTEFLDIRELLVDISARQEVLPELTPRGIQRSSRLDVAHQPALVRSRSVPQLSSALASSAPAVVPSAHPLRRDSSGTSSQPSSSARPSSSSQHPSLPTPSARLPSSSRRSVPVPNSHVWSQPFSVNPLTLPGPSSTSNRGAPPPAVRGLRFPGQNRFRLTGASGSSRQSQG